MNDREADFWQRYLGSLPAGHAHRQLQPEVFAFGDSAGLADELADLVCRGIKRATTSLAAEYLADGDPLPRVGDVSIVLRGDAAPVAIIESTHLQERPFGTVDAEFAAHEGEGDGSLAYWQRVHREYFARVCQRLGGSFGDETPVLCQRFRVLFTGA